MRTQYEELERTLIGCFFLGKSCFDKATERGVVPEDFSFKKYRDIYKIMLDKYTSDILAVMDALEPNQK